MSFRPLYTFLSTFVLHTIEFTVDPKWSHHAVEHSTVCMFKDLHFRLICYYFGSAQTDNL